MNRVEEFVGQYMRESEPALLDQAIEAAEAAGMDRDDPGVTYSLGMALLLRFHLRQNPDDLEASVAVLNGTAQRGTEQQRLRALSLLAHTRLELYRIRRQPAQLRQCVAEFHQLVMMHRLSADDAADFGQALVRLNELGDDPGLIDNAIIILRAGLDAAGSGRVTSSDCLLWLSTAYLARFAAAGDADDLHAGLRLLRDDPDDGYAERDPGGMLVNLAQLALLQPADEDLDRAAVVLRAAARFTPGTPGPLDSLARVLLDRYLDDGHPGQVTQARKALSGWAGFSEELVQSILGSTLRELDQPGDADYERICRLLRFLDAVMPPGWQRRGEIMITFSRAARTWYRLTLDQAILDEAIDMLRRYPGHEDSSAINASLGLLLAMRHNHCGDEADVDEAAAVLGAAPGTLDVRAVLGPVLLERWELRGDRGDLDAALAAMREVVAQTPEEDGNRPARIANLATALRSRYGADHDKRDLDEATALSREVLAKTPPDAPSYLGRAAGLGAALALHEDQGSLAEAIELLRAATRQQQGRQGARTLASLAGALRALGWLTWNPGLLDEALTVLAECADTPDTLTMLARTRHARYEILGEATDLDEAVRAARSAAARTPDALPQYGEVLRVRADVTGSTEDAEEAVRVFRQVGEDTPAKKVALGLALCSRFEAAGARQDIDDAARYIDMALSAMDADDRDRPGTESDLGLVLVSRFGEAGDRADLERAIELQRRAVASAGSGDPDRARRLLNLSGPLRLRYEQFGALADLDESLESLRTVVFDLPYRAGERPGLMADLGVGLALRASRTGEHADLAEGSTILRQALELMPATATGRPKALSGLAITCTVAALQGVAVDGLGQTPAALLDSAVELERAAIESAEPGHSSTRVWRANLAGALLTRHQVTGDRRDCVEAVAILRTVMESADDVVPDRGRWLANLAFGLTDLGVGYAEELATYQAAAEAVTAPADVRVDAARWWGTTAGRRGDWPAAVTGYSRAIELLPLAVFRGLGRSDQEFKLSRLGGLACDAAACAIRAGDPDLALELLEQGRGILLAQAFETRDEFGELEHSHPDTARRFRDLRAKLDAPETTDRDQMYRLAQQCTELIEQIRSLPGFERFLLPPTAGDLRQAVPKGSAAVLVNISQFGCDALIVTTSGTATLPLPGLSEDALLGLCRDFLAATLLAHDPAAPYETQVGAVDEFRSCLARLAELIVTPILSRLGTTRRLWWIPTGLSAFLPLHAAGEALDRAVSSYIPTLSSLPRERRSHSEPVDRNGIIVTATAVPGLARLTEGDREARQVAAQLPGARLLSDASPTQVLKALGGASIAHFICHAQWDVDTPSASRLVLNGGELSVQQIAARRSPTAFLAYLSACSTSRGNVTLADESIHISSAFQIAGYRHVIASLWPVADSTACDLATAVYASQLTDPAVALHTAARELRDSDPGDIVNWSAFIHTGP